MAQISVSNLTFNYEGSYDNIFEQVSFSIDTNWKLGFIGRNGKGKTTFLRLLLGELEYVGNISSSVPFAYFPYEIRREDYKKCASEFLEYLKPDYELWEVICELNQLDIDAEVLYRPFQTLSEGERTKVMLALLFSGEEQFLLIDEPTNHLDQQAREVVKAYLAEKSGFILVSHDRDLLDGCIDHVLVLNRCSIEVQKGNFSSWFENKNRADEFSKAENEKHKREIEKLKKAAGRTKKWADKNEQTKIGFDPVKEPERNISTRAYIGAKTKKMQSRVRVMEHRIQKEITDKEGLLKDIEEVVDLKVFPMKHHKNRLCCANDFGLQYEDAMAPVVEHLNFELCQGERLFLEGPNGCGKTSLIKSILKHNLIEEETADKNIYGIGDNLQEKGSLEIAAGMTISYINQDTSFLKGSIAKFCKERGLEESLFCAILRQLDMSRIQFEKDMKDYSEGQKKKVLIAASLMTPAHLYIWDEPMNYIDIFSRMQIEKLILQNELTMLLVEHDVRFREKIGTKKLRL